MADTTNITLEIEDPEVVEIPATVLVIDDERPILENVAELLSLKNHTVLAATNGPDGLVLARKHLPDVILCDIMMHGMNGYEVLTEVRRDPALRLMPFVFLTAVAGREATRRGMALRANDYLTKPFDPEELFTVVRTQVKNGLETKTEAERKRKELSDNLFFMLPHELRTPLVTVLGYAELLMYDGGMLPDERVQDMGKSILDSGMRLHSLIENFLVHSQIEILSVDPERQEQLRTLWLKSPGPVIDAMAQDVAMKMGRFDDLHVEISGNVPVQVAEDSMNKITQELVSNAFKFSQDGMPVYVRARADDTTYYLHVTDTGRGMRHDQIADIAAGMQFDRRQFEQQGAGLGLWIAKRLTELHAGSFHIASTPGEQTTVEVRLLLHVQQTDKS